MYILLDKSNNLIACHDEITVVEEYQSNLKFHHDIDSRIKYVKDKKAIKHFGDKLYEMELVAYRETYVPYKYIDYVEFASHDIRSIQFCKDTLLSLYRDNSLSKREEKNVKKVIYLLDDILSEANNYTASPTDLEKLKSQYDEIIEGYKNNLLY
jgi:hypothetical protein